MREYKAGDVVLIKSKKWYNANKDSDGSVQEGAVFISRMSEYCGRKAVITKRISDNRYYIDIDDSDWKWSAEFFEDTDLDISSDSDSDSEYSSKGCNFCKNGDDVNIGGVHYTLEKNVLKTTSTFGIRSELEIKHCPMCGKKLN